MDRRWHYSVLKISVMLVTIERTRVLFTSNNKTLSIPLPDRMWKITKDIVLEYETQIADLEAENKRLRMELRGSGILSPSVSTDDGNLDTSLSLSGITEFEVDEDVFQSTTLDSKGEPWSLVECMESVFQPNTVHYLSTGLIVNSFVNSSMLFEYE